MRGIAYGVGVGPGDPELLTLKAARLLEACPVIAAVGRAPGESAAWRIASAAVPSIAGKRLLMLEMPMSRDAERLREAHLAAARQIEACLDAGDSVACLVLGDPALYSSFSYLMPLLAADGYEARLVSGVPSFCAAAARLNMPLARGDEPLHILPAAEAGGEALSAPGACVLMKVGGRAPALKARLRADSRQAWYVENCGMPGERVLAGAEAIPDDAGYFSIVIAREDQGDRFINNPQPK